MNPVKKTVADKVLGVTLDDVQKGYLVRVDLTSSFGTVVMDVAGGDIGKHTTVDRRGDATVYRVVVRRVWR
jgi:hypothetical protein